METDRFGRPRGRACHQLAANGLWFCSLCYANKTQGPTYPGHAGASYPSAPRKKERWSNVKKPASSEAKGGGSAGPVQDPQLRAKYPTVLEYLTQATWDDGSARETSALSVFIEHGYVKVAVNDRACRRSLYVAAKTLQEALAAAEEQLKDDAADWRPWGGKTKK